MAWLVGFVIVGVLCACGGGLTGCTCAVFGQQPLAAVDVLHYHRDDRPQTEMLLLGASTTVNGRTCIV
jgi:hypothetical protein